MCFFLRGFNNRSRARRNNGCPDAATANLADNALDLAQAFVVVRLAGKKEATVNVDESIGELCR